MKRTLIAVASLVVAGVASFIAFRDEVSSEQRRIQEQQRRYERLQQAAEQARAEVPIAEEKARRAAVKAEKSAAAAKICPSCPAEEDEDTPKLNWFERLLRQMLR